MIQYMRITTSQYAIICIIEIEWLWQYNIYMMYIGQE